MVMILLVLFRLGLQSLILAFPYDGLRLYSCASPADPL
jgi:hypothetical protein